MTFYKSKKEVERMKNHVIDDMTDMTEYDLWEYNHPYDDIIIA